MHFRNKQLEGGELTLLHDEFNTNSGIATKETSHPHCIFVPLQKSRLKSQKNEFAFSSWIQIHLQDFWQKSFRFLLSLVIIRSDKMSYLFIHFIVLYSSLNLQYKQSLWKHYKQNNLL